MASLILDAGALIAIERGDRQVAALLSAAASASVEVVTSSTCVAQVWRDPVRQVRIARALVGCVERSLDPLQSRRCGVALGCSSTSDIADGAVAALAKHGDTVLTSDPDDIGRILAATGTRARVRPV